MIDEVQKVPQLLDEAHWLHENRSVHFALCGSSARKVKRGQANLLGGRAVRYELHGLTAGEIGRDFNLDRLLNHGTLPRMYLSDRPQPSGFFRVPQRGIPIRYRAGELLDHCARLWRVQPYHQGIFSDPRRHAARPVAARVYETPQTPGHRRSQILLC